MDKNPSLVVIKDITVPIDYLIRQGVAAMKKEHRKDLLFGIKFLLFLFVAPIILFIIFWAINMPSGITILNDTGATLHAGDIWEEEQLFSISLEKPVQISWDSEAFYQYVNNPEHQMECEMYKENGYAVYLIPFKCCNWNYTGYYDLYTFGKKTYIKGLQCTFFARAKSSADDVLLVTRGKFPAVPVPISKALEDEYIAMVAKPDQIVKLGITVEKEAKNHILAPEKISRKVYRQYYQFVLE